MGFSNVFFFLLLLLLFSARTGDSGSGLICDAEDGRQPELVGKFLLFIHSRCYLVLAYEKKRSWIAHEFLTHFSLSRHHKLRRRKLHTRIIWSLHQRCSSQKLDWFCHAARAGKALKCVRKMLLLLILQFRWLGDGNLQPAFIIVSKIILCTA